MLQVMCVHTCSVHHDVLPLVERQRAPSHLMYTSPLMCVCRGMTFGASQDD